MYKISIRMGQWVLPHFTLLVSSDVGVKDFNSSVDGDRGFIDSDVRMWCGPK